MGLILSNLSQKVLVCLLSPEPLAGMLPICMSIILGQDQ